MILLGNLENETEHRCLVRMVHKMPFDETHGLHKSIEELELYGVMVEQLPIEDVQDGMQSMLYYNPLTQHTWYEYVPILPIDIL